MTDKSIAVLPFDDYSADGNQAWFANGLSEEIVNALVRTPDLTVASRTSSFSYRDSTLDIPQIAAELGVAHILEGSVRRSDSRLRVTAQLVRASDGIHLWSENYDRSPDDAIVIQEDLAISISQALQTAMDPDALNAMQDVGTDSISAYNAYLQGIALEPDCVTISVLACLDYFEQAINIDPEFAAAHFQLARIWMTQLNPTTIRLDLGLPPDELLQSALQRTNQAILHATNEVDALRYRAFLAFLEMRLRDAQQLNHDYIALRPNDSQAILSLMALESFEDPEPALSILTRYVDLQGNNVRFLSAVLIWGYRIGAHDLVLNVSSRVMTTAADDRGLLYQVQRALLWVGEVEQAALATRLYLQAADDPIPFEQDRERLVQMRQACAEGRGQDALQHFGDGFSDEQHQWLALHVLGRTSEAQALLEKYNNPDSVFQLFAFFGYPQFDHRPFPHLLAILEREGMTDKTVTPLPFACAGGA